jgi:hypothetical protein
MDDQITAWLKDNPGIVIKRTNAVTGEIVDRGPGQTSSYDMVLRLCRRRRCILVGRCRHYTRSSPLNHCSIRNPFYRATGIPSTHGCGQP